MTVRGSLEFDGNAEFSVALTADSAVTLRDVRLEIPLRPEVARYLMGLDFKGGARPDSLDWTWEVKHNQDGAWLGDVNAGLQFSLKDDKYSRPLNTNFYLSKPLVMPASWANAGRGGCRLRARREAYTVVCYSGARTMAAGEVQHYDFRLLLTPFHPIDTKAQWATRYFHAYVPLDSIAKMGANIVNVHHATAINPFINYPFLRPDAMKAYIDSAHARGIRVKIYYTVRELTNHAPEIPALRSLGDRGDRARPGRRGVVAAGAPRQQLHRRLVRAGHPRRGGGQHRHFPLAQLLRRGSRLAGGQRRHRRPLHRRRRVRPEHHGPGRGRR